MLQSQRLRAMLMLLITTMIWGGGFIATEYAIAAQMPASAIMMVRFLVGSLMIFLFFPKRILQHDRASMQRGCLAGIILFFAFYSQTIGQRTTAVSNSAFLTATNVLMVPFIVWIMTGKRPKTHIFFLCLMTMLGVILLSMQGSFQPQFGKGDLLELLGAFLFALHIAFLGVYCQKQDAVQMAFWQLLTSGLCGIIAFFVLREPVTAQQWQQGIVPVLYLGLFSTGVAYLLQTRAQTMLPAPEAGVIMSAEGFFGTLFSLVLGLEAFRWNIAVGGLLITLSIIVSAIKDRA